MMKCEMDGTHVLGQSKVGHKDKNFIAGKQFYFRLSFRSLRLLCVPYSIYSLI